MARKRFVDRRRSLDRLQREDAHVAVGADRPAGEGGAKGVRAVLDHHRAKAEPRVGAVLDARHRVEVARHAGWKGEEDAEDAPASPVALCRAWRNIAAALWWYVAALCAHACA